MWPYSYVAPKLAPDGQWDWGVMFPNMDTLGQALDRIMDEAHSTGVVPGPTPDRVNDALDDVTKDFNATLTQTAMRGHFLFPPICASRWA